MRRLALRLALACLPLALPALAAGATAPPTPAPATAAAVPAADRLAAAHGVRVDGPRLRLAGRGFVLDSSHPQRPGDAHRQEVAFRLAVDPWRGDATLELEAPGEAGAPPEVARYLVRRGKPFQLDEAGHEIAAVGYGDLSPATLVALSPQLVSAALLLHRENAAEEATLRFAWNDALWRLQLDAGSGRLVGLERAIFHDLLGDGVEAIRFADYREVAAGGAVAGRIAVTRLGREVAAFEVTSATAESARVELPAESEAFAERVLSPEEVVLREVAPHLFTIDLAATDSRVTVVELADGVAVLEGAYHSRNGDLVAHRIEERLGKPIRWFAMSHLHGQYLGGVRSMVEVGATVLVPPRTVPLVEQVVAAPHALRPDALAREPRPLRVEGVGVDGGAGTAGDLGRRVIADATNRLELIRVDSGHTDDYLIFWLPRQKVLVTGDLFCYRGADQELRPRGKQLCATVAKLGLDPETIYVSWPLASYGCQNTVSAADFRAACAR